MGHYFIGNLGEEDPLYWFAERGGTILFIYFFGHNYAGGWLVFHFMVHALNEGQAVKLK